MPEGMTSDQKAAWERQQLRGASASKVVAEIVGKHHKNHPAPHDQYVNKAGGLFGVIRRPTAKQRPE